MLTCADILGIEIIRTTFTRSSFKQVETNQANLSFPGGKIAVVKVTIPKFETIAMQEIAKSKVFQTPKLFLKEKVKYQ